MSGRVGQARTRIWVHLDAADHQRVRALMCQDQTASAWLRGLINDALEEMGEPLLHEPERIVVPTVPRHGTLCGYNYHRCRCVCCRRAARDWRRRRRAQQRAA